MNVVAQRFEPDPRYVDYWIDLSIDPTGNVIKSYSDNQWLPLNRKADQDQWRHIQEIVDAVGLKRTDDDKIVLPENDNVYFTGDTITEQLAKGDKQLNTVTDDLADTTEALEDFKALKGQKNGLAELDKDGTVPREQLPAYVDDVIDVYATFCVGDTGILSNIHLYEDSEHTKEITEGERDKIYINVSGGDTPWPDEDTVADSKYKNIPYQFRWSGTQFVHIDCNVLILGQITGTAFDGGRGKAIEDTVGSINKLVKEITTTPTTEAEKVKIKFSQGTKNDKGIFEYTSQEVSLDAATSQHAGVMSKDDKATVDTAKSLPTAIVSTITKEEQTDHHNVNIKVNNYTKSEETGSYTSSEETITITNADNTHAGMMSAEDHTKLWTTLPGELAKEKTDREAKDTEIEKKHTAFEEKATQYKTETETTLTEIKNSIKNIADKTGLSKPADGGEDDDYTLPESEKNDNIIKEAKTVFEAVEKLDKFVYEDCVHWTKEQPEQERKVIVLPQHSSLKGTIPDNTKEAEPKEKTLHIASINSLNTDDENPPSTVQQVEIGNTDLHLDLKSKDRPTVEVMESTTAWTEEAKKVIYNMVKTGIMTMDQVMPIQEKLTTKAEKVQKHVAYSQDELWYGVKFDMGKNGGYYDGTRTGNLTFHKELPIQSKMRGCTIDDKDDSIKYLKDTDWKHYADGDDVADPQGSHLNFFVEIPEHYRLFLQTPDNNVEIRISEYNLPGYTHVEKKYIGAYEATTKSEYSAEEEAAAVDTGTEVECLWSRPNWQIPVVTKTRQQFQQLARKTPDKEQPEQKRSNNWNMYTYDAHTDMTWLFVVEYATLYSQKDFNKALTPEGYHQGGLGKGVTTGVKVENNSVTYSFVPAGVTHVLGSNTGIVCYDDSADNKTTAKTCTGCDKSENSHFVNSSQQVNSNTYTTCSKTEVPRYRGIENPFGHVRKNTVDVIVSGEGNQPHDVYICRDWTKFKDDVGNEIKAPTEATVIAAAGEQNPPEGYNLQPFKECPKQGWLKELVGTNWGDLFCKECNGAANKYYTDHHWTYTENGITTAYTLLIGGSSANGTYAGLFSLYSADSVGSSSALVGTRLTFYGEPTDQTKAVAKSIAYAMQPQYEEGLDAEGQVDTHTPLITIPHDGYVMNDDNPI